MTALLRPADYHSDEVFEQERTRFLRRCWTPVCRSDEVAAPGAQKPVVVATTPVLVTRDRSRTLHAVSNVCRHRGLLLKEAAEPGEVLRCPYHLWTYGLDGRLLAAPFMEEGATSGCDLPRYEADEWGGFVFARLEPGGPSLEEWLAPLAAKFEPDRLAGLATGYRIALSHAWNWKVMVENFGESYHHIATHAATLQPLWPGGETDSTPSTDRWIEILHPDHPEAGTLRVFVVFPLFLLAFNEPHGAVLWYRLAPLGPERIELEIVGLYAPERAADPDEMQLSRAQVFEIHREDMDACARVQAGLRSPDAVLGPLSRLEAGVGRFRDWVAASLSAG